MVYSTAEFKDLPRLMDAHPFWLSQCKNFRIVVDEQTMRSEIISLVSSYKIFSNLDAVHQYSHEILLLCTHFHQAIGCEAV